MSEPDLAEAEMNAPQYPAGPWEPVPQLDPPRREALVAEIEGLPATVRQLVSDLSPAQFDTLYRNWTIRQLVHHLADSHVNCYIRFKLALTEQTPTIKPYDEGAWAALSDSRAGEIGPPLSLLDGVHSRWVQLLRSMTEDQFSRSFLHPELGKVITLDEALGSYTWHGRHHTAQIKWVRTQHGW